MSNRVATRAVIVALTFVVAGSSACRRSPLKPSDNGVAAVGAGGAEARGNPSGTVGPLPADCHDATNAKACPPDPTDPSGAKLPAHGGACRLPLCRPCGSETQPAFRDESGQRQAGFCTCVPMSDDSGRGVFSCYTTKVWKERAH